MARRVRVVTDSSAYFPDPEFPAKHEVVIVPLTIHQSRYSQARCFHKATQTPAHIVSGIIPQQRTSASVKVGLPLRSRR